MLASVVKWDAMLNLTASISYASDPFWVSAVGARLGPSAAVLLQIVPSQCILGAPEKGQRFRGLVQIGLWRHVLLLGRRIALSRKQAFFDFSKGSRADAGHLQKLLRIALCGLLNGGNAIPCENPPQMRREYPF